MPEPAQHGMRFSRLTTRIAGEGADAWDLHTEAVRQMADGEVAPDAYLLLSVGEPDFDTPRAITDAAIASLNAGQTHYTEMRGTAELRTLLAQTYAARLGSTISADQVTVLAGAQSALFGACLILCEAGDEVIVIDPAYVTYAGTLGACGAGMVMVAALSENQFVPRASAIAAAITPATRAILINDPANPTGAVIPEPVWRQIADIVIAHDLWLIVDEVYRDLAFAGETPPFSPAALPGMAARTVMVSSLSKSHAMSGWRLGWSVGPPAFAAHAAYLNTVMLYGAPEFIQVAACAALRAGPDAPRTMAREYALRAGVVVDALRDVAGLRPIRPAAGMFVMVDVRGCGISAAAFAQRLFAEAGIVVLAGDAFGAQGAGHVRIGLVAPPGVLRQACASIAALADRLCTGQNQSKSFLQNRLACDG